MNIDLKEARDTARKYNVVIGKLTTTRDSQGEYELREDGLIVAEGWFDSASEIKAEYINDKVGRVC